MVPWIIDSPKGLCRMPIMRYALMLVVAAGCAGTQAPPMPPLPAWEATEAQLAPGRCDGAACVCRATGDDAEKAPIPEGLKRFELRVSTGPGVAWVTIDGQKFYKSGER